MKAVTTEGPHTTQYDPLPEISVGKELSDQEKAQLETLTTAEMKATRQLQNTPYQQGQLIQYSVSTQTTELGTNTNIKEAVQNHLEAGHLPPLNLHGNFQLSNFETR